MATTKVPSTEGTVPFIVGEETHQTWYKVFGDIFNPKCTPLVVCHGGPGLSHDYLIPISDLASASRPVLFYDQIGSGRSTHLPDKARDFWSIALFIDELVNLLVYFDIQDDFDLLGHSWGGSLSTEFEVRMQPPGLKHLILSNTTAETRLWSQSNEQLLATFQVEVQDGLAAGFRDPEKCRAALAKFHAVHGCRVKPVPKEVTFSVLDQIFGAEGDATVNKAM